ncbi:MAG: ribosomal-protein-alanine N-acetyltransferase [Candidatus Methanomethylicota archaeon]|uniref:Ribosomal-protein-alanine N-acetyltransferase n=1 Tax=Thermoproteota archaeon TaxID=2056631 RepID=A0A497EM50_9CREN|nr:MAG: ribosomal-protein-alanine N-acetyltransferase [Candidatus Verstraetearchaeota archaeon]
MEVKLRNVSLKDLDEIYEIEKASFNDLFYPKSVLKNLIILYGKLFIIAEVKGKIIGYVIARKKNRSTAHLVSIAVTPSYRGMGIGKKLLNEIINKLAKNGATQITLEVEVNNKPAIHLYKDRGFEVVSEIKNYYGSGRHAYRMILKLMEAKMNHLFKARKF